MKIKKTKYGFSLRGENEKDYDFLGKLIVALSKKYKEDHSCSCCKPDKTKKKKKK